MGQPLGALVNIDVEDLEEAERFYCEAFGLRAGRRFDGWMELIGLPVPLYLLPKEAGSPASPQGAAQRHYDRHWTPVHLDLLVADLDSALDRAIAAGAVLEAEPRDAPYGRIAMIGDPLGHGWCLIQFNDQGYDCYG